MDKLGTYALVAALKGLAESGMQTRRRENDRWISLQASTLPEVDMAPEQPETSNTIEQMPMTQRPYIRTSYIKEINRRHDAATRAR